MNLFVFLAAHFGLAYVVGFSGLSLPVRSWLARRGAVGTLLTQLLECPACFGFWAGIATAGFSPAQFAIIGNFSVGTSAALTPVTHALFTGLAVAGTNMATALFTGMVTSPHKAKMEAYREAELELADAVAVRSFGTPEALAPSSTEAQLAKLAGFRGNHAETTSPVSDLAAFATKDAEADDKMEQELSL